MLNLTVECMTMVASLFLQSLCVCFYTQIEKNKVAFMFKYSVNDHQCQVHTLASAV